MQVKKKIEILSHYKRQNFVSILYLTDH